MRKVDNIKYNIIDMMNIIMAMRKIMNNMTIYFTQINLGSPTNIVFSIQKLMNLCSPNKIAFYIDV